jgi:hypothetical protein
MVEEKTNGRKSPVQSFATETRVIGTTPDSEAQAQFLGKVGPVDPIPDSTRAFLEVVEGPGEHGMFQIAKPILLIGRAEGIVDVFVDDEAASRYHAAVAHRAGKFILVDMGSTNGTLVNESPAHETELKSGDHIKIGTTVILFGVLRV